MSTTTTVRTTTQKGKQPDNDEGPSNRPPPENPENPDEPDPDPEGSESSEKDEEADFLHSVR